jgi:subtilisin family serine protease
VIKQAIAALAVVFACTWAQAAVVSFNDSGADRQWYLDSLNFGEAWSQIMALPTRGRIKVAVIDSGFDVDHNDLQRNLAIRKGINIVNGGTNLSPVNPHGTGTIGILAATSGNGKGISQAAWTARAIPVRVSNRSDGAASTFDLANGIRYAADQGARVINLSYTGVQLGSLNSAAKYAQKKGAVVFMAAGNDGKKHPRWKNQKQLVAVGSTDRGNGLSSFSSRGSFVDLVAPGRDILSLTTNDRTRTWSGTSFSSPIAASIASLMLTANPELGPWQVRKLLAQTATDLGPAGRDDSYGAGLVNASAAVAAAIATQGRYKPSQSGNKIVLTSTSLSSFSGLRLVSQLNEVDEPNNGVAAVPEPGTAAIVLLGFWLSTARPGRR